MSEPRIVVARSAAELRILSPLTSTTRRLNFEQLWIGSAQPGGPDPSCTSIDRYEPSRPTQPTRTTSPGR